MIISQCHGPDVSYVVIDGTVSRFYRDSHQRAASFADDAAARATHRAERVHASSLDFKTGDDAQKAAEESALSFAAVKAGELKAMFDGEPSSGAVLPNTFTTEQSRTIGVDGPGPSQAQPDKTTTSDKIPTYEELKAGLPPILREGMEFIEKSIPGGKDQMLAMHDDLYRSAASSYENSVAASRQEAEANVRDHVRTGGEIPELKVIHEDAVRQVRAGTVDASASPEVMQAMTLLRTEALKKTHPGMTLETYREMYGSDPVVSIDMLTGIPPRKAPVPASEDYPVCPDCGRRHPKKMNHKTLAEYMMAEFAGKPQPAPMANGVNQAQGAPQSNVAHKCTPPVLRSANEQPDAYVCPDCGKRWVYNTLHGWATPAFPNGPQNQVDVGPGTWTDKPSSRPTIGLTVDAEPKGGAATIALQDEFRDLKGKYEMACKMAADMHAAAVGEVRGPGRDPVSDVAEIRERMLIADRERRVYRREAVDFWDERNDLRARVEKLEADLKMIEQARDEWKKLAKGFEKANEDLLAKVGKLGTFKAYVHDALTRYGVPVDPNPERTANTGCRIAGRLAWIEQKINDANKVAAERVGGDPNIRGILLHWVGSTEPDMVRETFKTLEDRAGDLRTLRSKLLEVFSTADPDALKMLWDDMKLSQAALAADVKHLRDQAMGQSPPTRRVPVTAG
jgi:hypothetical protein